MKRRVTVKSENGVTITAMIVAVILLIILTAVSITAVRSSERDVFETAYDAKTGMEVSTYQEELDIIDVQCASEQLSNGLSAAEYITLFKEAMAEDSIFDNATIEDRSSTCIRIQTEEGYVFIVTQADGVEYAGVDGETDETYAITDDDVTFTYSPSDWTNEAVTVTISFNFDIGDDTFQYSIDGKETWEDYAGSFEVTANGKIYVMYETYGDDCVVGEVTNIDKLTPEEFSYSNVSDYNVKITDYTTNTITIAGKTEDQEATDEDGCSGMDHYEFGVMKITDIDESLTEDDMESYYEGLTEDELEEFYESITWYTTDSATSSDTSYTFTKLEDETAYTALIKGVDKAGNYTVAHLEQTTEKVPGGNDIVEDENENDITVITFNYSDNYTTETDVWTTEDVTVEIQVNGSVADDVEDGTYIIQYSEDGETWWTYEEILTFDANVETLYARLYDGNNGGEAATTTITCIDQVAPTTPVLTSEDVDDTTITVSVDCEDETSGIATYYYYIREYNASVDADDSTSSDDDEELDLSDSITGYTTSDDTFTFTGLTTSTSYIIRVVATDNAGNVSEKSSKMKISTGDIADLYYEYNHYGWGLGDSVYYSIDLDGDGTYTDDWEIYYLADAVYDDEGNITGITSHTDSDGNVTSTVSSDNLPDYVFIISTEYLHHTKSSDSDTHFTISDSLKQNMLLYEASMTYNSAYAAETYLFENTSSNATNYPNYSLVVPTSYSTYGFTWFSTTYPYYKGTTTTDDEGNSTTTYSYSSKWSETAIDIDTSTLKYFMNDWLIDNYTESTSDNTNEKLSAILSNTNYWTELVDTTYASYAIGTTSLEMFVASWNQAGYETLYLSPSSSDEDGYSANGYEIGFSEDGLGSLTYINYVVTENSGYDDSLYFPSSYSNYTFSSPSAYSSSYLARIFSGGYMAYSQYDESSYIYRYTTSSASAKTYTVKYYGAYLRPVVMISTDMIQYMQYDSTGVVQFAGYSTSTDEDDDSSLTTANMDLSYTPTTWTNGTATVSITLTDSNLQAKVADGTYVFQYTKDLESGEWTTVSESETSLIEVDENCYIYVRLFDGTRASTNYATAYINIIDKNAPSVTLGTPTVNLDSLTVNISSGSDADEEYNEDGTLKYGKSGIDYYAFEIYDSTKTTKYFSYTYTDDGDVDLDSIEYKTSYAATSYSITNLVTSKGVPYGETIYIYAYAKDKAGNWSYELESMGGSYKTASFTSQATSGNWVNYSVDINSDGNKTDDWRLFYVYGGVEATYPAGTTVTFTAGTTITYPSATSVSYSDSTSETISAGSEVTYDEDTDVTFTYQSTIQYANGTEDVNYEDATKISITSDGDGHIFLIAADYVSYDNSLLNNSATGMSYVAGRSYVLYWKSAPTIQDFSSETNEIFMAEWADYYESATTGNGNIKAISTLLNTENWAEFVDSENNTYNTEYADYAIGSPTLEMWVAAWNSKYGSDAFSGGKTLYLDTRYTNSSGNAATTSYGYYINSVTYDDSPESWTTDSRYIYVNGVGSSSALTGYYDSIFFPHRTSSGADGTYVYGYWLASPNGNASNDLFRVYYGGTLNNYSCYGTSYAVRPVVSLASGVTATYDSSTGIWTLSK